MNDDLGQSTECDTATDAGEVTVRDVKSGEEFVEEASFVAVVTHFIQKLRYDELTRAHKVRGGELLDRTSE